MGDLVGLQTIAEMTGLTRGTVYWMRGTGRLPDPDEVIDGKPLWRRLTIEVWDSGRRKNVKASTREER